MSRPKTFVCVFLLWTLLGVVSKMVFIVLYHRLLAGAGAGSLLLVLWHGLRLDAAIAGYLTAVPALLLTVAVWKPHRLLQLLWQAYTAVAALACALAYVANLALYGYWGFPLDDTPLLYLKTSPAGAMASMEWWQMLLAGMAVAALTATLVRMLPAPSALRATHPSRHRLPLTALLVLMTAALMLPIRGGLGTGTNHTGSVYFSDSIRLNHAAVNPVFSFVEAMVHHQDIGTKYRFMTDAQASALFSTMTASATIPPPPDFRPNVILIVLESFSDTVMHMPGVTPRLQQLLSEGMYFSRFYASSFRTDRALVSIHSALPAQPTMSLMDIPRKSTALPSIASVLARNGYSTSFYYGGDVNYSNMRSYFMGTGFQRIVSETDFPISQRTGKWGVADGPVYERMTADIKARSSRKPFFMSIMTESSHEPFDVPAQIIPSDKVLNAFAYADQCLGRFVDSLKAMPEWQNTLVVIVPDHLGAFPDEADNYQLWRYRIPLLFIGGALHKMPLCHTDSTTATTGCTLPVTLPVVGSQTDIAATLLHMLGIAHGEFVYSKNLLDADAPHFALFTFPDAMGLVTDSSSVVYDITSGKVQHARGTATDTLLLKAKAYLQKLYDDLENL